MSEQRVWWIGLGDDQSRDFHEATLTWVRGLGLVPEDLLPEAEVIERDGTFEFHADQVVRDEAGKPQRAFGGAGLLTRSVVLQVKPNTWPTMPEREVAR